MCHRDVLNLTRYIVRWKEDLIGELQPLNNWSDFSHQFKVLTSSEVLLTSIREYLLICRYLLLSRLNRTSLNWLEMAKGWIYWTKKSGFLWQKSRDLPRAQRVTGFSNPMQCFHSNELHNPLYSSGDSSPMNKIIHSRLYVISDQWIT